MEARKENRAIAACGAAPQPDPYGIARSLTRAQQAWLEHPQALWGELLRLQGGMAAVAAQVGARWFGLPMPDVEVPVAEDERFQDPVWSAHPGWDALKEQYLLLSRWLVDLAYGAPGLDEQERRRAGFWTRQYVDALAPTNFLWGNPVALLRALQTGGASLADGLRHFIEEAPEGLPRMVDMSRFRVGGNLATTPGAVVMRNELVELIQYAPSTERVRAIPVVIVAPWINKYYILDLNERKSLVRWLTGQGFTVFVTSWRNPGPEMRDTTFEDYVLKGVGACVEAAREICGVPQVHLTGYCIGGTAVAAYMAWMNREAKPKSRLPVAHWSLFTTLVDFSDPGDIGAFIDEAAVEEIERRMAGRGYLDGAEMATSFRMLRPNSLIWHYWVHNYLLGEEPPAFDVLYWNMDSTRMPEAMHRFYLRELYLHNRLAQSDALVLGGRKIDLGRIAQPLYAVGTEQDHIVPWRQSFRICGLVKGPVRYALSTSGHVLGVVNPPVQPPKRAYWAGEAAGAADAEAWRERQPKVAGTWWEDWAAWLGERCGDEVPARAPGSEAFPALAPAPGTYVLER
ncbi:PHA/PHB synthase family protein [Inmirania thermothiophila]|uniref:Polyhydroxyalkanoate synthase n=1 Tax=Inmirania thermothiophila TaxID=1750597 RepID=A0A3N1XZJ2_9GAMM|nr:alpha/beta fold hydrolase [Inmirania thermothiophila]ROR31989.1 polyhydroxyalkanoate synthase [Inmirania thermothiophila]